MDRLARGAESYLGLAMTAEDLSVFERHTGRTSPPTGFIACFIDFKPYMIKKIGSRVPHDFRKTAVRNLERAGVSPSDAMKMVGHLTESIYRRYAISDERSMRESAGKLDKFHAADQQQQNSM